MADLTDLFESTLSLHERFGVDLEFGPTYNLVEEEVAEFQEAVADVAQKKSLYISHPEHLEEYNTAYQHALEEMTDVFVTMFAHLASVAPDAKAIASDLLFAIEKVIRKNNAKTWETHSVNEAGKIAKKK